MSKSTRADWAAQVPYTGIQDFPALLTRIASDGIKIDDVDGLAAALAAGGGDGGAVTWASITGKPEFGSAAYCDVSQFATAAQGAKADSALQQVDVVGTVGEITVTPVGRTVVLSLDSPASPPAVVTGVQLLTSPGVVDIVNGATEVESTGSGDAITLADGVPGQMKSIVFGVSAGGGSPTIEVLVVGGGGGGAGGGGGGGGVQYDAAHAITVGVPYPIVIGAGGAGAIVSTSGIQASNGNSSTFDTITAIGGGGGGNTGNSGFGNGAAGGSGGGGGPYSAGPTTGGAGSQGNAGGGNGGILVSPYVSGGGGGGGGAGASPVSGGANGAGGAGYNSSISGASTDYAGGGGGSSFSGGVVVGSGGSGGGGAGANSSAGNNGAPNTGGGGGGVNNVFTGGNGGSGVVIIRYLGGTRATGGTITHVGGYTIHTFTVNDTFTMTSAPGSVVLTPATCTGFTTVSFPVVGASVLLQFFSTRGWVIIGEPYLAIAT